MATTQQIQAALAKAKAAGDTDAISTLQAALGAPQGQVASPTADPETLTKAFYKARAAGDEDASTALFHGIRQSGATLRGPTQDELAAYGKSGANGLGSSFENSLAGAGKSFYDNARGIAQAAVGGAKLVTMPTQFIENAVGNKSVVTDALDAVSNKYDQLKADQSQVNQQDAPLMSTKAGIAGNIVGQGAQAVAGGALASRLGLGNVIPQTYNGTAISGAIQGAIQPISSEQDEGDRVMNAGIGAAGGAVGRAVVAGGGQLARRAAGWTAGKLLPTASPEVADLAKTAIQQYGIPLKASQVTDSRVAKVLDSVSSKVPFSGAYSTGKAQQTAFNKAVASTIGEDADAVTPALYAQAKKRIGQSYDDITSRNTVDLTDAKTKLGGVLQDAKQTGSDDSIRAVSNLIDRIGEQAPGDKLPGQAFQSMQSQLGQIARSGGEKGNYAGRLRTILSEALDGSISPADKEAWRTANSQYANLKTIRDLVTKDQIKGDVSPAALLGRVTATGAKKEAVASGRGGDLAELASIGQQFLKDGIPNSGTSERAVGTLLLGGAGWAHLPSAAGIVGSSRAFQGINSSPQVLAMILKDPSIDDAVKSALLQKWGQGSAFVGQQGALERQRQSLRGGR